MRGIKKGTALCSPEFARVMDKASKAALIDALWCACALGTNETALEILAQASRNLLVALQQRGDRVWPGLNDLAHGHIDSDGNGPAWQ